MFYVSGGGADLNFKIVGGTTQPSGLRENTIWANTSTAITGYIFDDNQPATGSEGLIWIITSTSSTSLNALKKNAIQLCLIKCRQYVSGTWIPLDAYIYQNGALTQFSWKYTYLYKPGDTCASLTGGYTSVAKKFQSSSGGNAVAPGITYNTDSMTMRQNGSIEWQCGMTYTVNKIDLAKFSKLRVKGTAEINSTGERILRVWTDIGTYTTSNVAASSSVTSTPMDITVDVSSLTSSYYIGFHLMSGTAGNTAGVTITEMWLEE